MHSRGALSIRRMLPAALILLLRFVRAQMSIGGRQSNLDTIGAAPALPQCPREWEWACRNGECIPRYDTCDGIPQCSDGSDEWNCDQWGRVKQEQGFHQGPVAAATPPKPPITTTTIAPDDSYIVMSTKQLYFIFFVFVVLALLIVWAIRRRARQKAFARNRRGNLLQAQDSDEDDILISSMYS